MNSILNDSQRRAARMVGVAYLYSMAAWMFTVFVRGRLIVGDDALQTAQNILAHESWFRVASATAVLTIAADLVRVVGLFLILAPVHRNLALFATAVRIAGEMPDVTMAARGLDALRRLGAGWDPATALASLPLGSPMSTHLASFVWMGVASSVFAYLWIRSSYVPRALGYLGVVASLLLVAGSAEMLVIPGLRALIHPWYMAPMFFFEIGLGLWLMTKGLREPPSPRSRVPVAAHAAGFSATF